MRVDGELMVKLAWATIQYNQNLQGYWETLRMKELSNCHQSVTVF